MSESINLYLLYAINGFTFHFVSVKDKALQYWNVECNINFRYKRTDIF